MRVKAFTTKRLTRDNQEIKKISIKVDFLEFSKRWPNVLHRIRHYFERNGQKIYEKMPLN